MDKNDYYVDSCKHASGDVVRADNCGLDVVAVTLILLRSWKWQWWKWWWWNDKNDDGDAKNW